MAENEPNDALNEVGDPDSHSEVNRYLSNFSHADWLNFWLIFIINKSTDR